MKALGIVRRIDPLGRIVIPMEVRRVNGWEEGTPMEMFLSDEGLVIREYKENNEVKSILESVQNMIEKMPEEEQKDILQKFVDYIEANF